MDSEVRGPHSKPALALLVAWPWLKVIDPCEPGSFRLPSSPLDRDWLRDDTCPSLHAT